jgi:uncharacterized surface protein with fasciclin (FAS1) repeats
MTTQTTIERERLSKKKHLSITEALEIAGHFGRFRRALESETDLYLMLGQGGPFTVFAPEDSAFKQVYDELMRDRPQLLMVLKNHIVRGAYSLEQLKDIDSLQTMDDKILKVSYHGTSGAYADIGGARIIEPNIRCSNGIIHEINAVLMP